MTGVRGPLLNYISRDAQQKGAPLPAPPRPAPPSPTPRAPPTQRNPAGNTGYKCCGWGIADFLREPGGRECSRSSFTG